MAVRFYFAFFQLSLVLCSPKPFDEHAVQQGLKNVQDGDIETLISYLESTMQSLRLELESVKTSMEKKLQDEIQRLTTSMTKQRLNEIENLKKNMTKQRQDEIQRLKTRMAKHCQDEIENLKTSISAMQRKHSEGIAKQRQEFHGEITAIRQLYEVRQNYKTGDPDVADNSTSTSVSPFDGKVEIVDDIKVSLLSEKKEERQNGVLEKKNASQVYS